MDSILWEKLRAAIEQRAAALLDEVLHMTPIDTLYYGEPPFSPVPDGPIVEGSIVPVIDDPSRLIEEHVTQDKEPA